MRVYPQSAEEKLGFTVLRERIAGYVYGTLGEKVLSNWKSDKDLAPVKKSLAAISEMQAALRFDDPVPFSDMLDVSEVLGRLKPEGSFVGSEDLYAVGLVLGTQRRLRTYFTERKAKYPTLVELVAPITPCKAIETAISDAIDASGEVKDHASAELRRLRRHLIRRQNDLRQVLQTELRRAIGSGFATEEQPTIRHGRMVIPVRAEAKRKVAGFIHDMSATGQTVYIEPAACLDLNNEIREIELAEQKEVERILRALSALVREQMPAIRQNLEVLGALDALQAKARLSNELDAEVPQLNTTGRLDLRAARNPVLQLHFHTAPADQRRTVVPLDLTLGEAYQTLVITGPNAGGKSVAMKTVGLLALMLAYGLPLPADPQSDFCLFDQLFVDIGDAQSIEEDLSTFSSHLNNLRYMLTHAHANTLVLIDEAGTGTDPIEGGALAQAALEQLQALGARSIVTTHHGTLKVFAYETAGIENGAMEFDQATLAPTYRFQTGIPGSSYAFEIAARMQLSDEVLARARALLGEQKTALESLIATFERRNQELETDLQDARKSAQSMKKAQAQYEARAAEIKDQRETLRAQALAEADAILQKANAQVERTIREIKEAQAEKTATQTARAALDSLKQDVQQTQKKQKRKRGSRKKKSPVEQGPIRIGDQVVVGDARTAAEILELKKKQALVTVGSVRMWVPLDQLRKVGGPKKQQVTVQHAQRGQKQLAVLGVKKTLDVRGQRVDEALQQVALFVDEAIVANLRQIEILHGKGTGALRLAIHEYLRTRPDVRMYEEAAWNQGGAGVTQIELA